VADQVAAVEGFTFEDQLYTYQNYGYGRGTMGEFIGDADAASTTAGRESNSHEFKRVSSIT
jgi:hypothetical protein